MSLESLLIQRIRDSGPITVAEFMTLALGHSDYGYYMKKDPFGREGDFTTAPEITQMFGEVLGAWVADTWQKLGSPEDFILLECGPGRGTLMRDLMRATSSVSGFHAAARLTLMDISPVLQEKQRKNCEQYNPVWITDFDEMPEDKPFILIANEFLDALPVQQYAGHEERKIFHDAQRGFYFSHGPENIHERNLASETFIANVAERLKSQGGAAIFIDYGYTAGSGDTLQAVYKHQYCDVLEHIGDADLTAHVDFSAMRARAGDCYKGLTPQGEFLKSIGLEKRAARLLEKADAAQAKEIYAALHRLTQDDQMGLLFKVMGMCSDRSLNLAGF